MIKKLFLLSLIICTAHSHAMKRSNLILQKTVQQKSLSIYKSFRAHYELLEEIQNTIIKLLTHDTIEKKPKAAAYTVNALSRTNKRINALINSPKFSDDLIDTFAHKFYCSHETIAHYLSTKQAKIRLRLQLELESLCFYPKTETLDKDLDKLISKDINLEFTYNYGPQQYTALMLSTNHQDNVFELLLQKKANINYCNVHGLTALKITTQYPINPVVYRKVLAAPKLAINQQNRHGESALLRCLIHRRYVPINNMISEVFITMIREFLAAGADPELANNKGITPMDAANLLRNEEILRMIQHAIDQKHALPK